MAAKQLHAPCRQSGRRTTFLALLVFLWVGLENDFGQDQVFTNQATSLAQTNMEELPLLQTNLPATNWNEGLSFGSVANQPVLPGPTMGTGLLPSPIFGRSALAGPPSFNQSSGGAGLYQVGPVDIHAHLFYSATYNAGIESSPGQPSDTIVNSVSPGVTLDFGTHWVLDYTPTLYFYSDPAFQNTTTHAVTLNWGTAYEDWTFGMAQSFGASSEPLVETGMQTSQQNYNTTLNADLQLGSQWGLQSSLAQVIRLAPGFNNLTEWSASEWINYEVAPSLSFSVGLIGGYDDVSVGSDMPFEDYQGRVVFHPGPRLSFVLSGGIEDRQFIHPSAKPLVSPIFSGSLQYQLLRRTALSLSASRSVSPSFYGNQVVTLTAVTASIQQQLTQRWSLGLTAGYSDEPFTSIAPAQLPAFFLGPQPTAVLAQVRDDTTTYLDANLSFSIGTRIGATLFYIVTDNSSGQANYNYTSHQAGLSLSWQY